MENKSNDAEVPVFVTGFVTIFEGVDICQDSADYRLHAFIGELRVKAGNDEVNEFLNQSANTHQNVMIAGYHREGTEGKHCNHIDAYYAANVDDAIGKLGVSMGKA